MWRFMIGFSGRDPVSLTLAPKGCPLILGWRVHVMYCSSLLLPLVLMTLSGSMLLSFENPMSLSLAR